MEILLTTPEGAATTGFRTGTMRTLELKRDVVMLLEVGEGPLAPAAGRTPNGKAGPPIRITCSGSFLYDMQRYAATFHDRVDVLRLNPVGASDQLNCELLTVFFEPQAASPAVTPAAAPPAAPGQPSGLQVRVIQARGDPVTLRSPTKGIFVRCHGFDYSPAPGNVAGATGTVVAQGPGVLIGSLPSDPAGNYRVEWGREFRFEPDGALQVARLLGAAKVWYPQMGTLTAQEISAWMTPVPAHDDVAETWQLERVVANDNVVIDAPQLVGNTAQLEALVDRPQPAVTPAAPDPNAPPPDPNQPAPTAAAPPNQKQKPNQNPAQRFAVRGGSIQVHLLAEGQQMAASSVTVERQAHLEELTPAKPGEKPLVVAGDRLHVVGANTDDTLVTVTGRPGQLEAGGMNLRGPEIKLEKRSNHLWIAGPGQMTMPMQQDLDGKPIARPQLLDITWQRAMDFRSDTVVYQGAVLAKSERQFLRTEKLQATLTRPIDFANPQPKPDPRDKPDEKPQVAQIRCFGRAYLQGRTVDERGAQTAFDKMEAYDLAINKITGDIEGRGPGWLTHVAYSSDQTLGAPNAPTAAPQSPTRGAAFEAPQSNTRRGPPGVQVAAHGDKPGIGRGQTPAAAADSLRYLNVQFENSISGNLTRHVVTFGEQTTTVYGPIPNWTATLDAKDPDRLPPQALLLEAKTLTVHQIPASKADRGWFELTAEGNVLGQGANQGSRYTARGHRLTYSEQKQQLVLRGDGLSPAFFFQEDATGNSLPAGRGDELQYSLKSKHVTVTGLSSFNLDAPKTGSPNKKPIKGLK